MAKSIAEMTDDELRDEAARCDHRAVVMGESPGGTWSEEAKRLRRIVRSRAKTRAAGERLRQKDVAP